MGTLCFLLTADSRSHARSMRWSRQAAFILKQGPDNKYVEISDSITGGVSSVVFDERGGDQLLVWTMDDIAARVALTVLSTTNCVRLPAAFSLSDAAT